MAEEVEGDADEFVEKQRELKQRKYEESLAKSVKQQVDKLEEAAGF